MDGQLNFSDIPLKAEAFYDEISELTDEYSKWWNTVEDKLDEQLGTDVSNARIAAKKLISLKGNSSKDLLEPSIIFTNKLKDVIDVCTNLKSYYNEWHKREDAQITQRFLETTEKYYQELITLVPIPSSDSTKRKRARESNISNPSHSQKPFESRDPLKPVDSGGFGNSSDEISPGASTEFEILKIGMSTLKVRQVASVLKRFNFLDSEVDNKFTEATENAVRAFQKSKSLEETGIVDKKTYDSLIDLAGERTAGSHWLLKVDPRLWGVDQIKVGDTRIFHTHKGTASERPEIKLIESLVINDQLIVYARESVNAAVGIYTVTEPVHGADAVVSLRVERVFNPFIPLSLFKDKISFESSLRSTNRIRLFQLEEKIFHEIITLAGQPVTNGLPKKYSAWVKSEGNHAQTQDQLGFENDIESLASVIAMKEVKAPLAIGLFGKWGSGKSFFMKKLKKKIIELKDFDDETYIKNVVHVEFNSWHYSDTNLWASMVTKIFDTLDQYSKGVHDDEDEEDEEKRETEKRKRALEKMRILQEQKMVIEDEKQKLEKHILEKEEKQKEEREKLEDLTGLKILKLVLTDKHVRKDFSELKNPDIENIINDQKKLTKYVDELKKSRNNLFAIFRVFKSFKSRKWWFAIGTVLFVIILKVLATTVFKDQLEKFTGSLSLLVAGAVTFFGNLLKYTADARKNISEARDRVESLKKTFDERPEDDTIKALKENKKQIVNKLQNIDADLSQTKKEIEDVESGKQLLDFVEQRSKDTNYTSQLTLISWIRKDFENLSRLLRGQNNALNRMNTGNNMEVVLKVDRIILYVDDLDRCNEDIVVKVLEAIHLILAFDLFVVIVGVDPRWLNNALNEKYKMLFGTAPVNENHNDSRELKPGTKNKPAAKSTDKISEPVLEAATSYDYLEKIFQIPFCLKPINKAGREKLIGSLIEKDTETENKPVQDSTDKDTTGTSASSTIRKTGKATTGTGIAATPVEIPATVVAEILFPDGDKNGKKPKDEEPEASKPKEKPEPPLKVKFSKEESDFMKYISSLFGKSPRAINRYVNIYRIIKAHRSFTIEGEYSFDEFGPTLFLLGIIVGHSVHASEFIDAVKEAKDETMFKVFIENSKMEKELKAEIMKCSDNKLLNSPMRDYKRNIDLISRFSFRTLVDQD